MEYNEFKTAARRLAKTAHTGALSSALSKQLGVDLQELIANTDNKPIDFARAAEWLSQSLYGKSWNVVSADLKAQGGDTTLLEQWGNCENAQEAIEFLLARSDFGEDCIVSELTGYSEETQDDGRGFHSTRVSYQLVFDKPGNPRGEYAIYLDGHHGGLVGWEVKNEHDEGIHFDGQKAFDVLLGKPHAHMKTMVNSGVAMNDPRPGTVAHKARQNMSDFCTTPVDGHATQTFRFGASDYLVQGNLVKDLPEILQKHRKARQQQGSLASPADFNTGFMAAVLAILGEEAAMSPGLVLNELLDR